jgi:hypothetical protein
MSRSFTEPCNSGVLQRFSRPSTVSNPLPSESAAAEISPSHPINVSKYLTLRDFVSAVKQGCSPSGSGVGEANVSLRLVSFLEETQGRTWLNMRTVLSKYTALLLNDYFLSNRPGFRWIVLCLPPQRACIGQCQSTMLPRAQNTESPSRAHFVVCLSFRQCKYHCSSFWFLHSVHLPSGEKLHPDDDEFSRKGGLYPIQALVQPLSQRFRYHFEGTRETNKLDKVRSSTSLTFIFSHFV